MYPKNTVVFVHNVYSDGRAFEVVFEFWTSLPVRQIGD